MYVVARETWASLDIVSGGHLKPTESHSLYVFLSGMNIFFFPEMPISSDLSFKLGKNKARMS